MLPARNHRFSGADRPEGARFGLGGTKILPDHKSQTLQGLHISSIMSQVNTLFQPMNWAAIAEGRRVHFAKSGGGARLSAVRKQEETSG